MKAIVAALHGILTSQTDPSWPDKFDAWLFQRDPEVKVLKKEYHAGPFPRWNCWVKDPLLARSLANEIELFLTQTPGLEVGNWKFEVQSSSFSPPPIWLVAHSNGAVIALLATKRLIERGHQIGGLILTGAACEADVEKSGVLEWWSGGVLGAAIAYSSHDDAVLDGDPSLCTPHLQRSPWFGRHQCVAQISNLLYRRFLIGKASDISKAVEIGARPAGWKPAIQQIGNLRYGSSHDSVAHPTVSSAGLRTLREWFWGRLMWPYGCLGRTGWLYRGEPVESTGANTEALPAGNQDSPARSLTTRWYAGGHSTYFAPGNIEATFEQIYQDIAAFPAQAHSRKPIANSQPEPRVEGRERRANSR